MADYNYVVPTGTILPDTGDLLQQVENEFKAAFGQDLIVTPSTPQGLLIAAEVLARSGVLLNNATLANQINPNLAGGIFLDAILALTGSRRNPSVHTTVPGVLNGVAGTIVPVGSQVRDTANQAIFESLETVTLTGSPVPVTFRALVEGSLVVGIGTLTQIVTAILGWETVNNTVAGTPGSPTQSDASARNLRKLTLATQGSSLPGAIIATVYLVEGVRSLVFKENVTNDPLFIDPVTLPPHSIYLCVDGGSDPDVAAAILSKKSGGCNYTPGSVTENVVEPSSGQTYAVTFDRPTEISILVRVTISVGSSIVDPESAVKQAILDYAAGLVNGERGFVVGAPVSCFELAGAVTYENPGIYVKKVETAADTMSPVYSTDEIPISIKEIAKVVGTSITVVIV